MYPYLIWSMFQGVIHLTMSPFTASKMTYGRLFSLLYLPIGQFWFLYTLFFIFLLSYGIWACRLGRWGLLAFSVLLYVVNSLGLFEFWVVLGWVSFNMIYFAIGVAFGGKIIGLLAKAQPIHLVAIAAGALAVHTSLGPTRVSSVYWIGSIMAVAGVTTVVCLSTVLANIGALKFIRHLGKLSLQIYVAHSLAVQFARIALQHFLHINDPLVHVLLGATAGFGIPIALHMTSRRLGINYVFFLRKAQPKKEWPVTQPSAA